MVINPQEFLIKEIPTLHPLSGDYINFWRSEKQKSIEGHWLGGYYMPPSLYFYVNHGTILRNTKESKNIKKMGRPLLRDIEWMFSINWMLCRGFSGFENDEEFTGNYAVLHQPLDMVYLRMEHPDVFNSKNELKEFRHPRTLLEMKHSYHKGAPLFDNEAMNFMMLGSRDFGKTYLVGISVVLHQWLFNGATKYEPEAKPKTVDITVGAELAHYTNNMLSKTKFAYDNLPGMQTINGRRYPSPLSQQYKGSWSTGGQIIATFKDWQPGGWVDGGSFSTIKNRTFKDNPFADQGTRPVAIVLEEVGMFSNLKQVYTNTKDNLRDGLRKTGTLMMLGTGGDMEKGTLDAAEMFYEPEAYDILSMHDTWENRGNIAFFVPAYLALNEFKNTDGYTDEEKAKAHVLKAREKAKTSRGGSEALNKEIQYRPLVPSEMFLAKTANIFPATEIRNRLTELQLNNTYELLEKKVELYFDPKSVFNGVNYKIDPSLEPINKFPWNHDNVEGCVIIYEFPHQNEDGKVPPDAYIIGYDSFRANVSYGESFAAIYVTKTNKYPSTVGHNEIVACYVGRPYMGINEVNEILYKLSLFYGNAKIYFENTVGNTKDYFEKIRRLDLLARQPTTVLNKKASYETNAPIIYGYPMSNDKIKWEAIKYFRSWLLELRDSGKRNLDLIPDIYLLQQLLAFNMDGNFDAVMGMLGCIVGLEEVHNISIRSTKTSEDYSKFEKEFYNTIVNNKNLFITQNSYEKFSNATSALYN